MFQRNVFLYFIHYFSSFVYLRDETYFLTCMNLISSTLILKNCKKCNFHSSLKLIEDKTINLLSFVQISIEKIEEGWRKKCLNTSLNLSSDQLISTNGRWRAYTLLVHSRISFPHSFNWTTELDEVRYFTNRLILLKVNDWTTIHVWSKIPCTYTKWLLHSVIVDNFSDIMTTREIGKNINETMQYRLREKP